MLPYIQRHDDREEIGEGLYPLLYLEPAEEWNDFERNTNCFAIILIAFFVYMISI